MPDHEGSLAMIERIANSRGRTDLLPAHWVRFVAAAGDGPEADQRRIWLGRAYLRSGQLEDAIYCLQPAALRHFEGADELLAEAYDRLGDAPQADDFTNSGHLLQDQLGRIPSSRPPEPSEPAHAESEPERGVADLRKRVRAALAARRNDEAAEYCKAILELDPAEGEAFNLLESHLRKRGDYVALRQLLLSTTRASALPTEARRVRMREVALLSESKLRDPEAALSAWQEVVELDGSDRDAANHLKHLLHKAQRWDELCELVERQTSYATAPSEQATLLRELAQLQRDKRKDLGRYVGALQRLAALEPDNASLRDEFCQALIAVERWSEAVALLRQCIAQSADEQDELRNSHTLATILHEKLSALDDAYRVCLQILEFRPHDKPAFERMERIDEESGNMVRLLATLERRALLAPKGERPSLLVRMGKIAEERLQDLEKAAAYLCEALDLVPEDESALDHLCEMFERADRPARLIELLGERSAEAAHPKTKAAILRRMANAQLVHLRNEDSAAEIYRALLRLEEDDSALRFLRDYATRHAEPQELADILQRLAARAKAPTESRDLLFERAVLLHERLGSLPEAAVALKHILERLDPSFEPAIELLASLSVRNRDAAGSALALERRLQLAVGPGARLPLIKRLADTYENELADAAKAVGALEHWTREDPVDPEPYRRMSALLSAAENWPALLGVLDALTEREESIETRDQAAIAAARLAAERLGDVPGAWRRLLPLIGRRNAAAVSVLHDIAAQHGRQQELAALYVQLAQKSEALPLQGAYWRTAVDIFERELNDPAQAFEASLRMLATDLENQEFLSRVDRLAVATHAFRRLGQVYDRLLKQAAPAQQLSLLSRLADLLEQDSPEEALDRVLQACALAPLDETLLARAEALAQRTHGGDELLAVYEQRAEASASDGDKVRAMLRAARLSDGTLRDREQASAYLRRALALAATSNELADEVESTARELDWARPELGKDSARRGLVQAHREMAQHAEPELAEQLIVRGARLLQAELDDDRSAFDLLLQGLSLRPTSEAIYAQTRAKADSRGRLDAIDAQLARLAEDSTDLATSVVVLQRRGALLEEALGRFQDAGAVYAKLLQLNPEDAHASGRLRVALRRSGRYQELLVALNKQLQATTDPTARVDLLKEVAATWETDLRNRWEALDSWKLVLAASPQDRDATAALQRLERNQPISTDRESSRPDSTLSFQVAPKGELREIVVADAAEPPSPSQPAGSPDVRAGAAEMAREPAPQRVEPAAAEPEDGVESDAEPDDLAALDASVSARMQQIEELEGFEDTEIMADLDVRETLPLPPAARPAPPGDRATPPPAPPRKGSGSWLSDSRSLPPLPTTGNSNKRPPAASEGSAAASPPPLPKGRPPRDVSE